ncbi:MAG: hypothetical protein AB7E21_12105, partial [Pseudodonghicola sp.]
MRGGGDQRIVGNLGDHLGQFGIERRDHRRHHLCFELGVVITILFGGGEFFVRRFQPVVAALDRVQRDVGEPLITALTRGHRHHDIAEELAIRLGLGQQQPGHHIVGVDAAGVEFGMRMAADQHHGFAG